MCNEYLLRVQFHQDKNRADGLKRYYKKCTNEMLSDWKAKNPGRMKELNRRWAEANPRTEYKRKINLKSNFGITIEASDAMAAAQDWRCAICANPFTATPNLDHDHQTGRIRALLCHACNLALGGLRDDPTLLRKAADYIESYRP